jgi:IclR family transcriptional regulator, pca regulon regulatory protein
LTNAWSFSDHTRSSLVGPTLRPHVETTACRDHRRIVRPPSHEAAIEVRTDAVNDRAAPDVADAQTVRSFARGLQVIAAFGEDSPAMTVAQVARATNLNRATARRLLHTLESLGYARRQDDTFSLTPRVLELGYAFIGSFGVSTLALPFLERLSGEVHEAVSVGVLDDTDVVYIARVPGKRVMTISIGLGTRFPAYRTSLGRVLLSQLDRDDLAARWARSDRSDPTPRTVTDLDGLETELERVRDQGYALVDQELEVGVRSIAAPLCDARGRVVAAMNVSTHVTRTKKAELTQQVVPALLRTAEELNRVLATRPV